MAAPAVSDLTIYVDGAAICRTSGKVQTVLTRPPTFSPLTSSPEATYMGPGDLWAEDGDPAVDAMACRLYLTHKVTGAASALEAERTLYDEMRAITALIGPMTGVKTLRFDRSTAAAAAVSTELLLTRCVEIPRWGDAVLEAAGGMVETTRAYMQTEWGFWCPAPYFIDRVAAAGVDVASGAGGVVVANAGQLRTGVRFQVKNGSVVGAPTQLTVNNNTLGLSFVWTKGGGFTNGDYISWFHDDPRYVQMAGGTALSSSGGSDYCELTTGNNTIAVTANVGSLTLTATYKGRYLSL